MAAIAGESENKLASRGQAASPFDIDVGEELREERVTRFAQVRSAPRATRPPLLGRMGPQSLTAVNLMAPDDFTALLGNVVEHAPSVAVALAKRRPFRDLRHLLDELGGVVDGLGASDKVDVLRRYPDLAGTLADQGLLTSESTKEHESAGLHLLTEQQKYDLKRLNEAYRDKFGFPYVMCARENKAVSILQGLTVRMLNTPEREVTAGLEEVKKIARLRVLDLVLPA